MATVSLALNGSTIVAKNTRKRILSLADQMNYQPNLVARSLAGGSNQLIGVLIDSRAPRILFRMLAYIEKEAAIHGYRIIVGEAHDSVEHLHQIYNTFRQYNTDGMICLAHDYPGQEKELRRFFNGTANMVFLGRPKLDNVSFVEISRSQATRETVDHLISQGYRKISLVCSRGDYNSVVNRMNAFREALMLHGMSSEEAEKMIYRIAHNTEENIRALCDRWILPGNYDAVIFCDDVGAAKTSKYLQRKGVSIPGDVGIVGSDNDEFCTYTSPELSSVDDEQELQAACLIRMLMEILSDRRAGKVSRSMTVQSRLIIRESSKRS